MRRRLSVKKPLSQTLGISSLFFFLFYFLIQKFIPSKLPDIEILNWLVIPAILGFLCFKLGALLTSYRYIIEFDDDWLYIYERKSESEEAIKLERVYKLVQTNEGWRSGMTMYTGYTLHYKDDSFNKYEIDFFSGTGNYDFKEFLELVRSKNPYFEYRHPLDIFNLF